MLSFHVNASGPIKSFEGIARRAADTKGLLHAWGGYLRKEALKRADAAEGWAPLSEAYQLKLQQTRTSSVTQLGALRKGYASKLEGYLRGQEKKGSATAAADLQELRRLRQGGRVDRDSAGKKAAAWGGSKAVDRLRKRLAKAEDQRAKGKRATVGGNKRKADRHKLLGSVARQIVFRVESETTVETLSRVPWSKVHNEGGAAGNGATEPARPFLRLDATDMAKLSDIALEHFTGVRA